MNEWPDDLNAYINLDNVLGPIRESLEFAYDFERKNEDQDVPYDGYEHGNLVGTPGVQELLTVEHQEYSEERGRDLLDTLLHVAVMLGAELQRRQMRADIEDIKRMQRIELMGPLNKSHMQVGNLLKYLADVLEYDDTETLLEEGDDRLKQIMGLMERDPIELSEEMKAKFARMWEAAGEGKDEL